LASVAEWRESRLGDVVELQRGFDLPSRERRPGRVPIVSSGGVSGTHVEARVQPPGVITGRYGTLGGVFYLDEPFWPLNTTLFVKDFKGNDPLFVSYLLRTVDFLSYSDKAAVPGINRNHLHEAHVFIPSLQQQRRIAGILGTLDDKIALNRRMSETLEATVRATFGRWFLREDASRDWPIEALSAHLDVVRGLSYRGDGLTSTGVPLHNLNSVYEGGGYKPDGIKWYSGPYADRHTVEPGEVIVTNTEQGHDRLLIGHAALVPNSFGELGLFSHHLYRVRPKPGSVLSRSFLTYLINSPAMHDVVSGYSNGTTVQMLPVEALQQPAIRVPPASLVRRFDALVTVSQERQAIAREEAQVLAMLRDALLPRLLSGAIGETA
jgi:type I restriction enzyme S subunit